MYLFTLPDVNMSMFHVNTSFDSTYMDAVLKTDIEISNESSVPASNLSLHFSLEDANGKEIALKQNT